MRMTIVLAAALLCAGCGRAGPGALERYRMVERGGTTQERCEAARDVRDAYLRDHDDEQYRIWRARASTECMLARFGV